jgi:hypothetical protein
MAKKSILLVVIMFLVVLVAWKYVTTSNLYRPIKVENIARITLWGGYNGVNREASEQEVTNIVNWFNSVYDIRENKEFAGTTEESGIKIEEKDGTRFIIGRSGEDFEVQRKDQKGKLRSYWARQKDIKELLDQLVKKT